MSVLGRGKAWSCASGHKKGFGSWRGEVADDYARVVESRIG